MAPTAREGIGGRTLTGLSVSLGVVAAVLQITLFALWFMGTKEPPTGGYLVLLISLPLATLFVVLVVVLLQLDHVISAAEEGRTGLERVARDMTTARTNDQQQLKELLDAATQRELRVEREKKTVHLANDLARVAHDINRQLATEFMTSLSKEELVRLLRKACRDVVHVYEEGLQAKFRCCVKYLVESQIGSPKVATICRDSGDAKDPVEHLVEHNTDFREIWYDNRDYWYCGDISTFAGYENTTPDHQHRYRSVVTWPLIVRQGWGFRESAERGGAEPIVGFLCLDSKTPHVLNEDGQIEVAFSVADAVAACWERRFAFETNERGEHIGP